MNNEEGITMTVEELRAFMLKNNLGAVELAQMLGLTRPAVDHWLTERRRVPPPAIKLMRVLEHYPQLMPWVRSMG